MQTNIKKLYETQVPCGFHLSDSEANQKLIITPLNSHIYIRGRGDCEPEQSVHFENLQHQEYFVLFVL